MGFGILFIGYALTFGSVFFTTYMFLDIIGCAVMIGALVMLCQYNRAFKYPSMAAGILAFVYAAAAAMRFMGYGGPVGDEVKLIGERIYSCIQTYALTVASLVFYMALLYAVAKLAIEVELPEIAKRCKAYIIVFASYSALWVLFGALSDKVAASSVRVYNVISAGLTLFSGVWFIMMFLLIMSCMKWIAPADVLEAEARGEEGDDGILAKLGSKLDGIQKAVSVPREEKEAAKLRRELDEAEKHGEDNKE